MKVVCFSNVKSNSWPLKNIVWSMFRDNLLFCQHSHFNWENHIKSTMLKLFKKKNNSRVHNCFLSTVTTVYVIKAPYDKDHKKYKSNVMYFCYMAFNMGSKNWRFIIEKNNHFYFHYGSIVLIWSHLWTFHNTRVHHIAPFSPPDVSGDRESFSVYRCVVWFTFHHCLVWVYAD